MLKSYLTMALRTMRREPLYAVINLLGLAVGIAAVVLAVLYVQYELSFDTYHDKRDRIVRVLNKSGFDVKEWHGYVAGDPTPKLRDERPDVAAAAKMSNCGRNEIVWRGTVYGDLSMVCSEPDLFDIFSFDVLAGDPASLARPNVVGLTASTAQRLFGTTNVVGERLPIGLWRDDYDMEVGFVMADVPKNTHFTFDVVISHLSLEQTSLCTDCGQPMYALLTAQADTAVLADYILADIQPTKSYVGDVRLESLADIHFSSIAAPRQGDRRYVTVLLTVAAVLLLIACANYLNLATARSARRNREVGVRKTLGAGRSQLMAQFLGETVLVALLALPLAFGLLALALPFFNEVAQTSLSLGMTANGVVYAGLLGVLVLVGVLAGVYPALVLSSFQPAVILRTRFTSAFGGRWLRRGLVFFQFAASLALIAITLIVVQQLRYMQSAKLGFAYEQVVIVKIEDRALRGDAERIKQELLRHPRALAATASPLPGQGSFYGGFMIVDGPNPDEKLKFAQPNVDADFAATMDLTFVAGRDLRDGTEADEGLVNEAFVEMFGWEGPQEAIGQVVNGREVVGVVQNFHLTSLHREIDPLMMAQQNDGTGWQVGVRLSPGDVRPVLDDFEATWTTLGSARPFSYAFLEEDLKAAYEQETQAAQVFALFAGLAILVACLGLFGLAAFMVEQRTKEIGIRKVFGAGPRHILLLFIRDYAALLVLACVVAFPVAVLFGQEWLAEFAYRIELAPLLFVLTAVIGAFLTLGTVAYHAMRAARARPVNSLRYE